MSTHHHNEHIEEEQHEHLACDGEGHEHHHHADGSCCCHYHEMQYHGPNKALIVRVAVAALLYLAGMILPVKENVEAALMVAAAFIAGYDIVARAIMNMFSGKFFDEYFLMTFAAIAACIIGEYEEGAAVFVLYRIGELCQDFAVRRSQRTLCGLTGGLSDTDSGSAEEFISRFSRVYTPVILLLAAAAFVFLPLIDRSMSYSDSLYRALSLLVLGCPCAIVISVPMTYFAGIASASGNGIFFRNSVSVDRLAAGELKVSESEVFGEKCLVSEGTELLIKGGEELYGLAERTANKTHRIVLENIWFVIGVKAAVLILSILGISALWFAVFADSGVALIAILNSLRAFRNK